MTNRFNPSQPWLPLLARRWHGNRRFRFRGLGRLGFFHGPGQFEQQVKLAGRKLLAAATKNLSGQQINLLPEQGVPSARHRVDAAADPDPAPADPVLPDRPAPQPGARPVVERRWTSPSPPPFPSWNAGAGVSSRQKSNTEYPPVWRTVQRTHRFGRTRREWPLVSLSMYVLVPGYPS